MISTFRELTWGATPSGFTRLRPDEKQMMVVRDGLESFLSPEDLTRQDDSRFDLETRLERAETSPFYGRAPLHVFPLGNSERALVRTYRHGGVLRPFTGDWFFTWPPRPFAELAITEEARRRGIPTLEILAACVRRAWGPFYRGWLITRELSGADDLWTALQSERGTGAAREALLSSVANSVGSMHRKGVVHRDLNLKNILIRHEGGELKSYIIDFDKARVFPQAVPAVMAEKNLRRLLRSVTKLDPGRRYMSPEDWRTFLRLYREARS